MFLEDTIAAISTPLGIGAVCMVRISGKDSISIADKIFNGRVKPSVAESHSIHFGYLIDPENTEKIDSVLLSVMRSPKSYTGFDSVEISCHGGIVNTKKVLDLVLSQGARLAEPGEFTKLAYLNGKIDLSQVEAIADLIHAKTEGARKASMSQFTGNLRNEVSNLRNQLIQLCSLLEIDLDFAEENLLIIDTMKIKDQLYAVENQIKKLLSTYNTGHIIREGARVSILGKPNVGKSSLMNAMLQKDRAIVSHLPGTTRDYIEETIDINGIPFTFVDTAGIRDTKDDIEIHGIHFSKEIIHSSDLIIAMFDISSPLDADDDRVKNIIHDAVLQNETVKTIYVGNKTDLGEFDRSKFVSDIGSDFIKISAKSQSGIDKLKTKIGVLFNSNVSFSSPMISRLRHKIALEKSLSSLEIAKKSLADNLSFEFVALDIHNAIQALAEIVGDVSSDDVLKNIFSNFCIGK
ncbi:tRNA uridine-5-carboxymethylaminomethyl(34) synthesis GTPase MnmE [bacterium]|nr:MAG: tRNA uridine-5-carboxymethylaminomethyl(34) synthesis GTPase MnmE [bacterium]